MARSSQPGSTNQPDTPIGRANGLRRIHKARLNPLRLHPQPLSQRQGHPSITQAIGKQSHKLLVALQPFGFHKDAAHRKQQAVTSDHRQQGTGLKPDPQ